MSFLGGNRNQNKRLNRRHVLDVKLRAEQVRSERLRRAGTLLGAFCVLALLVLVFWKGGAWAVDRLILSNEAFAIQEVQVRTDGMIPREEILKWSGVKWGENLLALDLGRIKRDLELAPLIKSAAVERVMPRTLRLNITERQPAARVFALRPKGAGFETIVYHLDDAGYVLPPLRGQLPEHALKGGPEKLPILTNVNESDLRVGQQVRSPQVRWALHFIDEFVRSPMAGLVDVKHIDVGAVETLRVSTRQGTEVTLAMRRMDWQLRRWRTIHDAAAQRGQKIAELDLSITNNVPLRWQEAAGQEEQPQPTAPSATQRNRRKHV